MKIMPSIRIFILASFFMTNSLIAQARSFQDAMFSSNYADESLEFSLKGTGNKSLFFMKVFKAGFYMPDDFSLREVLEYDVPKRIEVSYFTNIPAEDLNSYTISLMKENMDKEDFKSVSKEIELMCRYFVDLKPGDRYALTYIPHRGTKFEYNGELIGIIKGEKFAEGLFSVWIGEKPMDKRIKKEILGIDV